MRKTWIIAEAGVNHNGSLALAKKMAYTAKACGADVVKYQTAELELLVSKHAEMARYQKENIGMITNQQEMLKKLLLTYDEFTELAAYCKEIGICFLSTPFDRKSIDFLQRLGGTIWKIPSGEITNLPYLEKIAKTHQKVILSTGMSTLQEVQEAVAVLKSNGAGEMILLHCTTQYPASYEAVNLNAMLTLKREFGCPVGYSDHTRGIEVPIAAVAMGAVVIEKHFTLDRTMEGPDHKASLEPEELAAMVKAIRNVELAFGSCEKKPADSERCNLAAARKSIIAACDIKRGDVLNERNLTTKRPGTGISPMRWYEILGTKAVRDFQKDELIEV